MVHRRAAPASSLRLAVVTSQLGCESFVLDEIAALVERVASVVVAPVRPTLHRLHGDLVGVADERAVRIPLVNRRILDGAAAAYRTWPDRAHAALAALVRGSRHPRVLAKNLSVFPKGLYLGALFAERGVAHVHAHWASVPATMAFVAARVAGVPWSFTAHRWDIAENNLLGVKVRDAAFTRVISDGGRAEILGLIGERDWPSLRTLHVGTAVPPTPPGVRRASGRGLRMACVANLVPKKGHRHLIDACGLLLRRGRRFVCDVIGDGPLRASLEAQVRDLGLQARVRLPGARPHAEILAMLARGEVDVLVLPSIRTADGEREGIPVALMEALAHGVPAVSTPTGEIPELLGDGAGTLVPPGDAEALAGALERVADHPDAMARIAARGYERVRDAFNLPVVVDDLVRLMDGAAVTTIGRAA